MRAVIQRVSQASVEVEGKTIGSIGPGLVVLVGIGQGDDEARAHKLADKVAHLRVFADAASQFNLSALDTSAEVLVISQFTLYGDVRKGRRPNFGEAAPAETAEKLVERFVDFLRAWGLRVATGRFQAHMLVKIHNDGPVTIILEI